MNYELRAKKGDAEIEAIAINLLNNYQKLFGAELKIDNLKTVIDKQIGKLIESYLSGIIESFSIQDLIAFTSIVKDAQNQKSKKDSK